MSEDYFIDTATMPLEYYQNMKKEIERLNTTIQSNINSYNKLAKYSSDLEDRIDKAIEYIEENSDDMHTYISQAITQILKGNDKE